jgi:hypothetical protein
VPVDVPVTASGRGVSTPAGGFIIPGIRPSRPGTARSMAVSSPPVTGSGDEPVRLRARGTGHPALPGALLSRSAAIRDAIYGRMERTRFRTGVTILAGCLVTGVALALVAAMLSRSAPSAGAPRAAARPVAVPPASPLASSYRPRPARSHTPAPQSQPQQLAPAAAGDQNGPASATGHPAQAGAAATPRSASWCWPFPGWNPPGDGRPGPPCAAGAQRWHQWHHRPGEHRQSSNR